MSLTIAAQSPALNYTIPSAVAPGKTTTITLVGENLSGATGLWTSFPAKTVRLSSTNMTESRQTAFQISVDENVPVGIGALRLATTNGVSSLAFIMIDDLASVAGGGTNRTIATAQELKWPAAVDGNCEEASYDYYRFKARKGRRLTVELVANRLGSPLDPVVRLLNASGRELVYCDDDPGLGSDPRFAFTVPASGEYLLEIRDVGYQGGPKHRYRLRLGDFPITTVPYPLGTQHGREVRVSFLGRDLPGLPMQKIKVPGQSSIAQTNLSVRFARNKGSSFVRLRCSDSPELVEAEPNDTPDRATKVFAPASINGRFANARDRDYFEFEASKGERLIFSGKSRSLGSPCDLWMQLLKPDGGQVAEADISGANEGTLTNTFKEAGTYLLVVEELNHQGGPDLAYRVEINPFRPGFTLSVELDRVNAPAGGGFEIKVTTTRREYEGPITLTLDGIGDDTQVENNIIAEKKNETTLKAKLPDRSGPGQLVHFHIKGHAKINDTEFAATASTAPGLRKIFPMLRYPPAELDGLIALGVRSAASKPEHEPSEKPE